MPEHEICDTNRLPLGLLSFSNIRKKNKIYVDKTSLIYKIASQDAPIFFSRPRRFGKSLLINTLSSLFTNGLEYFPGLDIEKKWKDKTYQVVHLDFSGMAENNAQGLKKALGDTIIQEFNLKGKVYQYEEGELRDPDRILNEICKKITDNSLVLLIDEYDAPLNHHIQSQNELCDIVKVLNNFYATVKQYTDKFRLIFITGVTRVSHVSIFSAFNNLKDLSFHPDYNTLLGFTKNELVEYFDPYIENAANVLNLSKKEIYEKIESYYDGFQFSPEANETLYNPWSILSFLQ
ncbi:MAG: AAA family ATPase, partial [Desulfovibrionaceae bacterium]|nr:AAA family ATPase [Desulfovibrionaceae bacterium]